MKKGMQLVSVTEEDALDRVRWRQLICVANGAAEGMRRHYLLFQKHQILHIQNPNVVGGGVVVKCFKKKHCSCEATTFFQNFSNKRSFDIQAKEFQQALYQCLFKSYKNVY